MPPLAVILVEADCVGATFHEEIHMSVICI